MPRISVAAGLSLAFLLAACSGDDATNATDAASATCGAAGHEGLVGTSVTDLDPDLFPEDTRFNFPGGALGEDVNPGRLNFEIGTDDTVQRVYCG